MSAQIAVDRGRLGEICRRYHVRKLAVFGSMLREDFRADSDVDLLIEFDPASRPRMVGMYQLEQELSSLFAGHKVDLVNPKYLNRRLRDRVLAEAEVQFAEG